MLKIRLSLHQRQLKVLGFSRRYSRVKTHKANSPLIGFIIVFFLRLLLRLALLLGHFYRFKNHVDSSSFCCRRCCKEKVRWFEAGNWPRRDPTKKSSDKAKRRAHRETSTHPGSGTTQTNNGPGQAQRARLYRFELSHSSRSISLLLIQLAKKRPRHYC